MQADFREGRSMMDIHVLYIVQKELKENEKVYVFFVSLKVAFDKVNREKL